MIFCVGFALIVKYFGARKLCTDLRRYSRRCVNGDMSIFAEFCGEVIFDFAAEGLLKGVFTGEVPFCRSITDVKSEDN